MNPETLVYESGKIGSSVNLVWSENRLKLTNDEQLNKVLFHN